MEEIISVKNVSYCYVKNKKVINSLCFAISKGSITALIGANGGGKSTTIKLLTGIIKPSEGEIFCITGEPFKNRKKLSKEIGIVFGNKSQLIWEISAKEYYLLHKRIYSIPDEEFYRNMDYFNDVLGIYEFYEQQVRTMSLGQRIKCDIVAGFLHNPKVVFLDEPTIGLDFSSKKSIRNAIKEINKTLNTSIIITSHDIDDIEDICDNILLLDKGQLVFNGKIGVFKQIVDFDECLDITLKQGEYFDVEEFKKRFNNDWEIKGENELVIYYNSKIDNKMDILKYVLLNMKVNDLDIKKIRIDSVLEKILK